ncbi:hypothetical protein ABFX02_10G077700 [Erythranthe guttata]
MSSVPSSSKRSRAVHRSTQNPCCQVEGCSVDLKSAKEYHGRHRICEFHSKSPRVVVGGFERRFCQQCSKLHDLSEFDDMKRSCRRRLSDHNARRRRVRPESIQLTSRGLSYGLYDQRPQNILMNGYPGGIFQETPRFSSNIIHSNSISNLHMDPPHPSNISGVFDQSRSPIAPNLLSAHSFLSSNSWSSNEAGKSIPMGGQIVHNNLSMFHLNYNINPAEQPSSSNSPVSLANSSVNNFDQHQEYRLFKASPYDSDAFYPTTQRNL